MTVKAMNESNGCDKYRLNQYFLLDQQCRIYRLMYIIQIISYYVKIVLVPSDCIYLCIYISK